MATRDPLLAAGIVFDDGNVLVTGLLLDGLLLDGLLLAGIVFVPGTEFALVLKFESEILFGDDDDSCFGGMSDEGAEPIRGTFVELVPDPNLGILLVADDFA